MMVNTKTINRKSDVNHLNSLSKMLKLEDFKTRLNDFKDDEVNIFNFIRTKDIDKVFCANYSYNEFARNNFKQSSVESLRCMYVKNIMISKRFDYVSEAYKFEDECVNDLDNVINVNSYNFIINNFLTKCDFVHINENENIVTFIECKNNTNIKNIIIQNFHTILLFLVLIEKLNKVYNVRFRYAIFYKIKKSDINNNNKKYNELYFDNLLSFFKYIYQFMREEYENIIRHVKNKSKCDSVFNIFADFLIDIFSVDMYKNLYIKYETSLLERLNKYLDYMYKACYVTLKENYDSKNCYKYIDSQSISLEDVKNLKYNCYLKIDDKYYIKYKDSNNLHEAFVDKFIKNVILL